MATAFFDDLVKLCGGASKSSNTTPPKPGRYELTQFIDTVETMQSQVEKEVEKNAFVVPTANFVDSLFSVSTDPGADAEVAKSVLERLKHNGLYDNRWCQFPDHRDATEQSFYLPFIRTVAGIGRALKGLGHQPRTHIAWPEVFDRTLTSLNPYAANVRPDIVSVLGEDPNDGPKEETEGEGKETNDKKRKAPDEQARHSSSCF
ncbi:hypothetical protein PUNSTDRAFT_137757 [Punctularia strigosozonata HHB-11173 SS5]|uniref:Uncharacterized protein n=1 Tax=Punctularia strigosozonata (strain HHB-11173) TaxID=741275 RepID=R7S4C1_PUNST|nr:uncharacterized protein PUNSTDRAFT_137757 [Punctularia strigosozonata HHB-11173 SS5]EIN05073.1 hypothetical protein PUNSTDRAFT_137757 [Punctularia strigosozonata HHB-11173 SS5]